MSPAIAQTVSPWSMLAMAVSVLICFGLPIGLAIWAKKRYKKAFSLLPLLGGAIGFLACQLVFRVPMLQIVLPKFAWFRQFQAMPWPYAIFLCVTAGLVEEPARFIVFAIMKKHRSYPDGLSYGIGHGGIEAVALVGLSYVNLIVYSMMINTGAWGTMISALPEAARAQYAQVGQSLLATHPAVFLMGGAERIFTAAVQIALSLVVLKGFMANKKWLYLVWAIVLHAAVDFLPALSGVGIVKMSPWLLEGVVLVMALISVAYIVWQARKWRKAVSIEQEG